MNAEKGRRVAEANRLGGGLIIQVMKRLGVQHFVLSPGSRSTPLALAVSTLGREWYTVCLDERSAAFHALGRVKSNRLPVVLVCTSGSAGAHYYPAVIEARESGLPLIVLTADRPAELHHCHAGQTIEQENLYGNYPVFQVNLPLPEADERMLRQVRELCRRAVESAMGWPMGPVHLNCPFREPFFSSLETGEPAVDLQLLLNGLEPIMPAIRHAETEACISLPEKTLILAGPRPGKDSETDMECLLNISRAHGWPVLADGVNPLRYLDAKGASIITRYDQIVRTDANWEILQPEAVLIWGEPPTSKVLRERLSELDIRGYQIGTEPAGMNPFHGRICWLGGTLEHAANRLEGPKGSYAQQWLTAESNEQSRIEAAFQQPHALFEGDVHRLLGNLLPEGASLLVTNSLAIRDAEWFMPARQKRLYPFSQRGANGIDGTLSLARGIADGSGSPVYLITGDLAFLHDSNGFLGAGHQDPGVFVVLLNNAGGGIFELLPAARHASQFEELFATPQQVDFEKLVEAHGGRHSLCGSLNDLEFELNEWDRQGLCVAEVRIDRKVSADLHRQLLRRDQ